MCFPGIILESAEKRDLDANRPRNLGAMEG